MRSDVVQQAWVLGGSGGVGAAVVRKLCALGIPTLFSYSKNTDFAQELASETGASPLQLSFGERSSLQARLDDLPRPSLICHCAAIAPPSSLTELDEETWRTTMTVNAESVLWIAQWARLRGIAPLDIVVTGGLDRAQSLPLPIHYAATQGMLSAMVMALGHELAPNDIRINMLSFGVMESGLSTQLGQRSTEDYLQFSALRRKGSFSEVASAVAWFGLRNTYVQGQTIPINGGI